MWETSATDEYLKWFGALDSDSQVSLLSKILLIERYKL